MLIQAGHASVFPKNSDPMTRFRPLIPGGLFLIQSLVIIFEAFLSSIHNLVRTLEYRPKGKVLVFPIIGHPRSNDEVASVMGIFVYRRHQVTMELLHIGNGSILKDGGEFVSASINVNPIPSTANRALRFASRNLTWNLARQ